MYLLRKVVNRARHEWHRIAVAVGGAARWAFHLVWPALWWAIAGMYAALPDGRIRRGFRNLVYTRPWRTFHRNAYIPQLRDLYFEYIATFFYDYPIRKGDVVVQIGASFGEETTRFARAVGRTGRVIGC